MLICGTRSSLVSIDKSSRLIVAGIILFLIAKILKIASTAPAAPSKCPIEDFVDDIEIEQAKKDLDARSFRQEYEATWEVYSGIVMHSFSMEHNVKNISVPDDVTTYHLGMVFNLDPLCATVSYIKDNVVYVFDEIQIWSSNTDELCQEIHRRYPGIKIFVYPDPASRQRKTSAGGRTDLSILQNAGFICKVPTRHMAVRDRINSVNAKLHSASGHRGIYIHPKCKNLLNSISKHTYKEGTVLPDKTQGLDHMTDAIGYKISFLYPVSYTHLTLPTNREV